MKITKAEFDKHSRNNNFQPTGPRIEEVPDNAPYQPYRHLTGVLRDGTEVESSTDPNWVVNAELDMIRDLTDALRQLHDFQNGCPLPSYEKNWTEAMRKSVVALRTSEPYLESKGIKLG